MENQEQMLETLREIRDGQREIIRLLAAQQTFAEEQSRKSKESIAESVSLQRQALQGQRKVTIVAVPGILACLAAIVWLVWRYF
ncbi:MAG: hypothetical protein ACKV2V_10580 [Blastocatellia bacterium]